jgi:DNA repair exonuclease SbcCD ATPase subunit
MLLDLIRSNFPHKGWDTLIQVLGEPPILQKTRGEALDGRRRAEELEARLGATRAELEASQSELEKTRAERLAWMGRESAVRKELQDAQERAKDLLEQVVRLTHQKREAAKDLLDQKFKTEATPLERNRFEMELTEARGTVRRAEERVRQLEEQTAQARKKAEEATREARRAKQLAEDLDWARRQSQAHLSALGAAIQRIQQNEIRLNALEGVEAKLKIAAAELKATQARLEAARPKPRSGKAAASTQSGLRPIRRAYKKPLILGVTEEQRGAFAAQA